MRKNILVIQPNETEFLLLNKLLNELNPDDLIFRYHSLEESLKHAPKDINFILANLTFTPDDNSSPIKQLRSHFRGVPIIVLSDKDDIENQAYAIRKGAQDILVMGRFDSVQLERAMTLARERKAILVRLRNVLADYKGHFDNGPIPMWVIDEKSMRFLIVNNAAVEKYGYSKEDFSSMSILDIRPKEEVTPTIENYHKRQSANYFDAGYWRHKKKNGEIFHVHVYSHKTQYENIEARLCFAVDVNDKILADQKNKELIALAVEQKEQLDNILSSINEAIWSRDADTHELLYGNKAYFELYGYTSENGVIGEKLDINTIHPDDRKIFLEAVDTVKAEGYVDYTYRYLKGDGSVKILKGKATYKKGLNGKPDTIDGITTDITREKELYDFIRNSEQRLLSTINNTQDLIWSVDKDLKIIFCNRPYQDFFHKKFGVSLDEGDHVLGNWHSDDFNQKRKEDYERALNGESFTTLVEEYVDGDTLYFEINTSPIIDIDEKIIGVNCVSRDITRPEKQLKKINEQNEKLRQIAWIQSHSVRSPVANILGLIPLFDDKAAGSEHNRDILEKLRASTIELDLVIKEIVSKTREIY